MIQEQVWPVEEGGRGVRKEGRKRDGYSMYGWTDGEPGPHAAMHVSYLPPLTPFT